MEKGEYTYSTAELAKYYGLTRKGIAFYEEKGIVSPSREENQKYRIFSLEDCYNLYHTKLYANCDFSLSGTADMLECCDAEVLMKQFEQKMEEMQREILWKERVLYHAGRILETFKRMQDGAFFEIAPSPEFYRFFVRTYYGKHVMNETAADEFESWNRRIPVNTASLKYSLNELKSGREFLDVEIGNIIGAEDFERFHYSMSSRVEHLPSVTCLHTALIGSSEDINKREWLLPALTWIQEHGYVCCGDPYTSMLLVKNDKAGRIRYEETWFPVEKR